VCLVVGWPLPIGAALLLLAAQYAAALALLDAAVDAGAPLYAAGLLLVGELSYWSLELRAPGREETRVLARRLVLLAALALVAGALGVSVLALTSASVGGGVVWDSVGIAAAVGVLAIIARLARRQSRA
jgi:cytochrome c oxidase assembly factor CtaG